MSLVGGSKISGRKVNNWGRVCCKRPRYHWNYEQKEHATSAWILAIFDCLHVKIESKKKSSKWENVTSSSRWNDYQHGSDRTITTTNTCTGKPSIKRQGSCDVWVPDGKYLKQSKSLTSALESRKKPSLIAISL